uniref:Putative ribonuclease H-like domain-containing protein n=1 Tax=Tanacetum cinerariifolium TaxID=118510 RepID=A0A6L2MYR2_TANCI|nr:putative ribonuclease H-like domain-containing protein [Tanacetum cinerariifolium]
MVAILEKSEHNVDFHPIVDFVEASPLRIETTKEGTKILATVDGILGTVTESSLRRNLKLQDEDGINEPASPLRDVSEGKACPTDSGFGANQDRATIAKTSTLPHDSAPRVTSPAAAEGSMQQTLNEFMAFCTSLQRQHSELISKFEAQELEINRLKARVKLLEDKKGVDAERSGDDAPIKGRNLDEEEAAAERVPTGSGSIPTAGPPTAEVPTGSDVVPTVGLIFATATVVTPYTRTKGKETLVESETPKKKKIQEQMARQLDEEMERDAQRMNEQIARDANIARIHAEKELQSMIDGLDRSNETVAKYLQEYQQFASELPLERIIELISDLVRYQDNYAKVHKFQTQQRKPWSKKQKRDYYMAVIKSNLGWKVKDFRGMTFEEIEAKFTTVWKQFEDFIPMDSNEEAERLKRKGLSLEQESVKKLKTSEEVTEEAKSPDEVPEEKVKEMMQLVPIEEVYVEALQVKHPIIDWKVHTEGQRAYWNITRLGGSSASYQLFIDLLKHLDREDLNQLWVLVKESLSNRPPTRDKEMELWVKLKRLYEPDDEDQLWTYTQNLMHASLEWKLYDTCRVHHVAAKYREIFMLLEKDYPLRKGLAIRMISYKLQVENYSRMANDLILKIYKIASTPRQQVIEFPLAEEVPIASEESFYCQKKREAIAVKIALLLKSRRNYQLNSDDSYTKLVPHVTPFKDTDYPDKVYKVVKALYGLHQAPRAWYETLVTYLLENGFQRSKIDQTLFIKRQKGDILLVQVYVDDIIFESTNKELCKAFEKLMKDKFQMSSMGKLTFFLGLQVKQKEDGIFVSQDKYVAKILRKFSLTYGKSASTPIDTEKPLLKDPDGEDVDVHIYMSMIGSLMYLTSSRPDIMFVVYACAYFQVTPKASHLHAVKRIFSDYARASLDRKSTTGGCQFLSCRLISWQCKKQTAVATSSTEVEYVVAASCCAQVLWIQNQLLDYGDPVDTPMVEKSKLDEDIQGKAIDPTHYREMVTVCSSLRSPKLKRTIESRAKRSSKIISLGHDFTLLASSYTMKSKTDIKSHTYYPCGIARTSE